MVRSMNQRLHCPNCDTLQTAESPFERWMRNERLLDSSIGIVRFDLDVLLHRYMFPTDKLGDRTIQAMMFIEVKAMGAELSESQKDTLHSLNQVFTNRRSNRHRSKRGAHAENHTPVCKVKSLISGKMNSLWLLGGHFLQMEHIDPKSSKWLKWDKKEIDLDVLVKLLRFELDPHKLQPIDWRRRTYTQQSLKMFTDKSA